MDGNTLILTVGEVSGNYWTGLAGDGKMSTAGNWLNGVPAEGADIDLSVISSATTIDADAGRTFGAATMGAGVITFMVTSGGEFYTWEIGEDGLSGSNYFLVSGVSGASAKIVAVADFTVSSRFAVANPLEIDTAGHEIRLGDGTSGGIYNGQNTGMTTIVGSGRVVADYDVDDLTPTTSEKTNAFTVAASATLALMPGTDLGKGMVTVEDGGTLEVAASGTATLNGGLALDDGAALAFNFTERATAPVLSLTEGTEITFDETTAVAVKVSGTVWPTSGEKTLTDIGGFDAEGVSVSLAADAPSWAKGHLSVNADGNIVLDIKPRGTMVIIR